MRTASLILMITLCFSGIQSVASENITVQDVTGRSITLAADPQNIIALSQGTLRLISMMGLTSKVVGIEEFEKLRPTGRPYIFANPELLQLPLIGPGGPASMNKEPDLESVLKVKPDAIFISYMESSKADELQKKLGIPFIVLTTGRFASFDETVYGSIRVLGKIFQKEKRAEDLINYIESAKLDLGARTQKFHNEKKPTVYVGAVGFKGTQGIDSTDANYAPLNWIGANNLAKKISDKEHVFVDREKLLDWNPEVIFLDAGGLGMVTQDIDKKPEFYNSLKAFKENSVFVLYPFNYYVTNISTVIVDAYTAGKILYPEAFKDIDPPVKADEVYSFFYGKPVYEKMEKDFGPIGRTFTKQIQK